MEQFSAFLWTVPSPQFPKKDMHYWAASLPLLYSANSCFLDSVGEAEVKEKTKFLETWSWKCSHLGLRRKMKKDFKA